MLKGSEVTSILYETLCLVGDTQPEKTQRKRVILCRNLLMRDLS